VTERKGGQLCSKKAVFGKREAPSKVKVGRNPRIAGIKCRGSQGEGGSTKRGQEKKIRQKGREAALENRRGKRDNLESREKQRRGGLNQNREFSLKRSDRTQKKEKKLEEGRGETG